MLTDKPEIKSITPNPYRVLEGNTATLQCALTAANPNTNIIWKWVKNDSPTTVLSETANYTISYSIQRTMSGSYSCTAMNTVDTSAATIITVDVQCKCILIKFYKANDAILKYIIYLYSERLLL